MKNKFTPGNTLFVKLFVFVALMMLNYKAFSQASVKIPFKPRSSALATGDYKNKQIYSLQGDFTMIGNANAFLSPYSDEGNNSDNMKFNKLAGDPSSIVNSSSANLQLPAGVNAACTRIVYAGLYWAGRGDNSSADVLSKRNNAGNGLNKKNVKFKVPNGNYIDLSATDIYYGKDDVSGMYSAYYDVTDLVRTAGLGTYAVGNIATFEGSDNSGVGYYAGWGMVVIYENTALKWRDITMFDGFAFIKNAGDGTYGQLDVSGFKAVQNGPVNIKMGMMTGEGDRSIEGDYFQIQQLNTNNYKTLSHGGNSETNFFNSSIYTGGNTRNPNYLNNFGIDVSMFDLPNTGNTLITNNQSNTSFRFGTTQDTYSIFNITFAVDAYVPQLEGLNFPTSGVVNQGTVKPGQELEFELDIFNKGTEAIKDGKVEIPLPPNLHFVSASPILGGGTATWSHPASSNPAVTPGGKIAWNIGNIALLANTGNAVAKLKYKVRVTNDCTLLTTSASSCGLTVSLNGTISGQGVNSTNPVNAGFIIGYNQGECSGNPIRDSFSLLIKPDDAFTASCPANTVDGFKQFKAFCSVAGNALPRNSITAAYPAGTRFYAQVPGTPNYQNSLVTGDFPVNTNGTPTRYYAVPDGMVAGCYLKLETLLEVVTTLPTVKDVKTCVGTPVTLNVQLSPTGASNGYKLYYFADNTTGTPLTAAPAPVQAGSYTYYVAEGVTKDGMVCYGNRVAFKVDVLPMPVITQNISNFYVCADTDKNIDIQSNAATVTWQFYEVASATWKDLIAGSFKNQLIPAQGTIQVKSATALINGVKIRAKLISGGACEMYSNEAVIEVRNCMIPTNPMIPAKIIKN